MSFYDCNITKGIRSTLIVTTIILFAYSLTKAICLPITWDEAQSFLEFVRKKIFFPTEYNSLTANNHLLNTWLSWITWTFLGPKEFSLRIPNLIAHVIFLVYSIKFALEFKDVPFSISVFILLNFNPYLVDFFSLSRGYGLSYGLLLSSLWYLYLFIQKGNRQKDAILSILLISISVFAHLTLINMAVIIFAIIILVNVINSFSADKKVFFFVKRSFIVSLIIFLLLIIIVPIGINLKNAKALFYGGETGFWKDTVLTLFDRLLYEKSYSPFLKLPVAILASGIFFSGLLYIAAQLFRKKISVTISFVFSLGCLLTLTMLATIVQFHWFDTLYLFERTALFLIIPFTLFTSFIFFEWSQTVKWLRSIFILHSFFMILHFINSMNLHYVLEWKYNADTKEMLQLIQSADLPPKKINISIGASLDVLMPINYYRVTNHLIHLNAVISESEFDQRNDYTFLTAYKFSKTNKDSVQIIKTFPPFGNVLAQRKYKPRFYEICLQSILDFENKTDSLQQFGITTSENAIYGSQCGYTGKNALYSGGINYIINDTLTPMKNSLVTVSAMIYSEDIKNSEAYFVISFEYKEKVYSWHRADVLDYLTESKKWLPIYFTGLVPKEAKKGDMLKVYMVNPRNAAVFIDNLDVKWIEEKY
jgi:hypothetical protein